MFAFMQRPEALCFYPATILLHHSKKDLAIKKQKIQMGWSLPSGTELTSKSDCLRQGSYSAIALMLLVHIYCGSLYYVVYSSFCMHGWLHCLVV